MTKLILKESESVQDVRIFARYHSGITPSLSYNKIIVLDLHDRELFTLKRNGDRYVWVSVFREGIDPDNRSNGGMVRDLEGELVHQLELGRQINVFSTNTEFVRYLQKWLVGKED